MSVKNEALKFAHYTIYVLLGLIGLYLLYVILIQTIWFFIQLLFYVGLLIAVGWGLYKTGFFERFGNQ